jgi:hypothetical protein
MMPYQFFDYRFTRCATNWWFIYMVILLSRPGAYGMAKGSEMVAERSQKGCKRSRMDDKGMTKG